MDKLRKWFLLFMSVAASLALGVVTFAESGGSGTANSSVTTAMQGVANDMLATGNAIIPIALTVVGIALVVVFGIRIFKKVVNK